MAALSDYLEDKLLNHIFRNSSFAKPSKIAIALTSGVPLDSNDGSTIPELPLTNSESISTGYSRVDLGDPSSEGNDSWNEVGVDNTSAYQVYNSTPASHSGYFYPLYLTEVNPQASYYSVSFEEIFPGVTFYSPQDLFQSGVETKSATYLMYEGNGFIKNATQIVFDPATTDWGWVSGIAILDNENHGQGNLLMYAELSNPRYVYRGDSIRFDPKSLEISLS